MQENDKSKTRKVGLLGIIKLWLRSIVSVLRSKDSDFSKRVFNSNYTVTDSPNDWLKLLDILQPLVIQARQKIEINTLDDFNWNMMGVSSYLYHIERLLSQVRANVNIFDYKYYKLKNNPEFRNNNQFNLVLLNGTQCCKTILSIIQLLYIEDFTKLHAKEFIQKISDLELDAASFAGAMRSLEQYIALQFKADTFSGLSLKATPDHDLDLLFGLTEHKKYQVSSRTTTSSNIPTPKCSPLILRNKLKLYQADNEFFGNDGLINTAIDIFDELKQTYIILQKSAINKILEKMFVDINDFLELIAEKNKLIQNDAPLIDKNQIDGLLTNQLHEIYAGLEAIRFNTNRPSRCSQNLFTKAKNAKRIFRKACTQSEVGQKFIAQVHIRKTDFIRPKAK